MDKPKRRKRKPFIAVRSGPVRKNCRGMVLKPGCSLSLDNLGVMVTNTGTGEVYLGINRG